MEAQESIEISQSLREEKPFIDVPVCAWDRSQAVYSMLVCLSEEVDKYPRFVIIDHGFRFTVHV